VQLWAQQGFDKEAPVKTPGFLVLPGWLSLISRRHILAVSLVAFLSVTVVVVVTVGSVSSQERRITRRGDVVIVEQGRPPYIPEATEPCTREESEWWNRTREAGNGILSAARRDNQRAVEKSKQKFLLLIYEGQQKGYHVPVKDRQPMPLVNVFPVYPPEAVKNNIVGMIELSIGIGTDGLVSDVEIVKGAGRELEQNSIRAWRQSVFLPAVRNGAFVADRLSVRNSFNTGQRRSR